MTTTTTPSQPPAAGAEGKPENLEAAKPDRPSPKPRTRPLELPADAPEMINQEWCMKVVAHNEVDGNFGVRVAGRLAIELRKRITPLLTKELLQTVMNQESASISGRRRRKAS